MRQSFTAARRARGFSLIELMVSITIGFAVVGALLTAYLAAARSGRNSQAMAQISEDANTALGLLRQQVSMAGTQVPNGVQGSGAFSNADNNTESAIFGCDGGTGPSGGTTAAINALGGCAGAGGTGPDFLAVAYQIDVVAGAGGRFLSNSVMNGANVPYDCIGNAIAATPGTGTYYADSHFYIGQPANSARKALYCAQGGSAAAGQPIAENVIDLQVRYLMAAAPDRKSPAVYYATQPGPAPGPATIWANTVGVQLCIEVVSADRVVDNTISYQYMDCSNTLRTPTDGLLHRAFTSTVMLQNKL